MTQAISTVLLFILDAFVYVYVLATLVAFPIGFAKKGIGYAATVAVCWPFWLIGVIDDIRHRGEEPREISSGWVDGYGWSVYEPISPLAQRVIIGGLESEWKAHDAARKMRRGEM